MNVLPNVTLIGRLERVVEPGERFAVERVAAVVSLAHQRFVSVVEGRGESWRGPLTPGRADPAEVKLSSEERFWGAWNVIACVGPWGRWSLYALLRVPDLGVHPAPAVTEQWVISPGQGSLRELAVPTGVNAPLVHQTTRLISPEHWPISSVKSAYAAKAYESLLEDERLIEDLMLHVRTDTQTVGGLERALRRESLRLVLPPSPGATQQFRTWRLLKEKLPGEVALDHAMIEGVFDQVPSESDLDRPWVNLDGALMDRV